MMKKLTLTVMGLTFYTGITYASYLGYKIYKLPSPLPESHDPKNVKVD